jgi:plastocyanin
MKFRLTNTLAIAGLAIAFGGNAWAAETADLKITFVYDSDTLPTPAPIAMAKDAFCAGAHTDPVLEDKLLVDADSKGIKNVVVLPDRKSNIDEKDVPDALSAKAKEAVVLDNVKCVFEPHVFVTVPGGKVTVKNSDQTGHNANFNFFANPAKNQIIPAGGSVDFPIDKAERAPIPVDCNVHPWMKAYVVVAETPFVGISNDKGELVIGQLPANKKIALKVWHESSAGAIEKVSLDGKPVEWKKGVIELTLKPGVNDLGVCKLKPEHFKK